MNITAPKRSVLQLKNHLILWPEKQIWPLLGVRLFWAGGCRPQAPGQGPNMPCHLGAGARAHARCAVTNWLKMLYFVHTTSVSDRLRDLENGNFALIDVHRLFEFQHGRTQQPTSRQSITWFLFMA